MQCLNTSIKKAAHAGGQAARRNDQCNLQYHPPQRLSNPFESRRQDVIQGLLAASTPAERAAIRRGQREGRRLRREVESL
ncbi:hypothetical protein ACFL5Z_10290 [Planctomycetota bacterium]